MIKKVAFFILSLAFITSARAQSDSVIYYIRNSHRQVSTIDSADYYVVISPPGINRNKRLYTVHEYYKNGKLKLASNANSDEFDPSYEGRYVAYFPDGTIMKTGAFYDGLPSGTEISYYPNGKMYKMITYLPNARFSYDELRDSTGKVLATKGTGEWLEFDASFTDRLKKGRISKGDKTGIWDEKQGDNIKLRKDNTKDAKTPTEYWCKIDGVSFVKLDEPPTFRGGMEAFGRYLGKTIRYPAYAREHSIQGKVLIAFKVNEKGELSDLIIKQSIWKDMDEEALRAVKLSSPWKPAMIGGKPVSVPFSVPINFALAND